MSICRVLIPEKTLICRELAGPEAERHRADQARVVWPAERRHRDRQQRPRHLVVHHEEEQHQDRKQRDHDEGVVDRHQHAVDHATGIAGDQADQQATGRGSSTRRKGQRAANCGWQASAARTHPGRASWFRTDKPRRAARREERHSCPAADRARRTTRPRSRKRSGSGSRRARIRGCNGRGRGRFSAWPHLCTTRGSSSG